MAYGTLTVADLLATQNTIVQIGEDLVWESIATALEVHNEFVEEGLADLVTPSTDQIKRFGGPDTMQMDPVDEFGRADAQKVTAGQNVGFPLGLNQVSVQWTRKYFQSATASEFATQFLAVQDADVKAIFRDIKRAVFYPTDKTIQDKLVNNALTLPVKALTNADGGSIPLGPDGTSFNGATHTHYLATAGAALAGADIDALIATVAEHYGMGEIRLYINKAQETTIRGFTAAGQFIPYYPRDVVIATTAFAARGALDINQSFNRLIGIWGNQAAEIWVKPWIPAGYLFAFMKGPRKPLVWRMRDDGTDGLVVAAEDEAYPLRARTMEREYGISVWERTNGAVMFITAGGVYVAPVIS